MSKLVEERISKYKENKINLETGKSNGIPLFHSFPKLGRHIPALPKGKNIMLTAGSGIGKSKAWTGIVLYSIYKLKKHSGNNFKIKVIIALLEDTTEDFIDRLFGLILYDKYKIEADVKTLNSYGETYSKEVEKYFDDVGREVDEILSYCEIIDTVYNPTGIYKHARNISNELGTHHYKSKDFKYTDENNVEYTETNKVYSHYVPNDPDLQVLSITDNLNNFALERVDGVMMKNQLEAINKWTRDYCRLQICKHWGWTTFNLLQQSAASEVPQYNNRGELIIDKIKPSLDNLGNSKECQRDHHLIFGLFAPDRFGIKTYDIYDISTMRDAYRGLIILKSNISRCNIEIPMYFNGASSYFKEL